MRKDRYTPKLKVEKEVISFLKKAPFSSLVVQPQSINIETPWVYWKDNPKRDDGFCFFTQYIEAHTILPFWRIGNSFSTTIAMIEYEGGLGEQREPDFKTFVGMDEIGVIPMTALCTSFKITKLFLL